MLIDLLINLTASFAWEIVVFPLLIWLGMSKPLELFRKVLTLIKETLPTFPILELTAPKFGTAPFKKNTYF